MDGGGRAKQDARAEERPRLSGLLWIYADQEA